MPVDVSWMREAANMPQMPSYAEQQQARNALALQGMQLQKGKMDLEEAMRARQGLAQLTEQLRGLNINEDPEKYFTVVAQNLAASGHADKLPTVLEALEKVKNAKEIARLTEGFNAPSAAALPSAAPSAAGFSAVPPYLAAPQPAAAQPNMLAPSAAAPSNALFKGKTREQWMDYAMNLTQRGSPLGKEIMSNMGVMFPDYGKEAKTIEQNLGNRTRIVRIRPDGTAEVVPGSEAAIAPGPRQPTDPNEVAYTFTDEAGNVQMFNKQGQKVMPTAAASPGQAPTPVEIKGKPSATFEKTRALRQQQAKDLDYAIKELESASIDGGLIDQSTGSGIGSAVDVAAGFFGKATPGKIAIGKLQPIADLVLKQIPRFEGPQSDKDTQSYKEAAGQLANGSLPNEIRKEAARTIIRLMKDRKGQFVSPEMATEGLPAGRAEPAGGVDVDALLNKYK